MTSRIIAASHSRMSVTTQTARPAPAGLSSSTQELWLAALRYRRVADAIAANDATKKSA